MTSLQPFHLTERDLHKTLLEELATATKSIENVKTFATTFLIINLIISSIVLFVINMINIRERKYEIEDAKTQEQEISDNFEKGPMDMKFKGNARVQELIRIYFYINL